MSDEESFVILGSSPMPSLNSNTSLGIDTSLKRTSKLQSIDAKVVPMENKSNLVMIPPQMTESTASDKLMSIKSNEIAQDITSLRSNQEDAVGGRPSLATSFLLGDVSADVLKNSVYSQFPSLCSMEACAEDVVKLHALMTEYIDLKNTLSKVENTMKRYYDATRHWKEEAAQKEKQYQQQLQECQSKIEILHNENIELKREVTTKMEQIEIVNNVRQKEHDELIQYISEKSALINNMRVQIDKLERQNMDSYEFIPTTAKNGKTDEYIARSEHDAVVKDLRQQLSVLLAENLDLSDVQKQYIDEITCLKVNLTAAEELIKQTRADVNLLQEKDADKTEKLIYLQEQADVYKRDFEMERADREKNAGEKEQYLQDLRVLQRRNQDLIEALTAANKKSSPLSESATMNHNRNTNNSYGTPLRDDQRPVRVLDPTGAAATTSSPNASIERCPLCSKQFKTLSILQSHVNYCLDSA